MAPDLWNLYALMLKSRLIEEAVSQLWKDGLISGEMHLGTGEEAIIAGIVSQLREGDAMALDHRGTSAMLMRGVDPVLLLLELLGHPSGLCRGMGGHMHLFSRQHLAASSGIVGAEGPAAAGFALAAKHLRPEAIAVAFFGEGAMNQGMLMEAMNLASAWKLPVLFVCKDDSWSIITQSSQVTGGSIPDRARGFGLTAYEADGLEVAQVWETVQPAIERMRAGQGPAFLHAKCVHLEGHFLGFRLLRSTRDPFMEMQGVTGPLIRSSLRPGGAGLPERFKGLFAFISMVMATLLHNPREDSTNDPIVRARAQLQSDTLRLLQLEETIQREIGDILKKAAEECVR